MKWTDEEISILKERCNDSYDVLSSILGKTRRAIKHKVGELGLQRAERARWTQQEIQILNDNPGLTPRDFHESGLLHRGVDQIAHRLRTIRGTALRKFSVMPSKDDAYLLGAICSDGLVDNRGLEMMQREQDVAFLEEVKKILENKGFSVRLGSYVKAGKKYAYLFCGGKSILESLGTDDAKLVGNLRGSKGEWVEFLNEKCPWVWEEEYFWSFIGGLFDGDGCGSKGIPTIAITPRVSALKIQAEFERRGMKTKYDGVSLSILGGEEAYRQFFSLEQGVLKRKAEFARIESSGVVRKVQRVLPEGAQRVTKFDIKKIMEKEHYLGTIPGGGECYALVQEGEIVAAAVLKKADSKMTTYGCVASELRRFVTARHEPNFASASLAAIKTVYAKEHPDIAVIISFADEGVGHKGTVYKAIGGVCVGNTGESICVVTPEGRRFSGRFLAQSLRASNVDVTRCTVEIVPGKHKFLLRCNMLQEEFEKKFKK